MKRIFLTIIAIVFSASVLTACNTVKGVGKDVQQGGQAIERTAQKVQTGR